MYIDILLPVFARRNIPVQSSPISTFLLNICYNSDSYQHGVYLKLTEHIYSYRENTCDYIFIWLANCFLRSIKIKMLLVF